MIKQEKIEFRNSSWRGYDQASTVLGSVYLFLLTQKGKRHTEKTERHGLLLRIGGLEPWGNTDGYCLSMRTIA